MNPPTSQLLVSLAGLCVAGLLAAAGDAQAQSAPLTVRAQLDTRQAWLANGDGHALDEARGELQASWKSETGVNARMRLSATRTRGLDRMQRDRVDIDELVVTVPTRDCLVHAGVQTVVWGQADRIQVVDIVHPLDLAESSFSNWENKRLPLAMLNVDCSIGNTGLQLLVVPQTRFNRRPTSSGRFAMLVPEDVLDAVDVDFTSAPDPSARRLRDWSLGLQWSGRAMGLDWALHGWHGWEPDRAFVPDADGAPLRRADRLSMLGASFTVPVGPVVMRGESALRDGVTQYMRRGSRSATVSQGKQRSAMLASDFASAPWFLSSQYLVQVSDKPELGITSRVQRILTLAMRRNAFADRLTLGAYAAVDLIERSHYVAIEAEWQSGPTLLRLSSERFGGNVNGIGRFREQSRHGLQLRLSF